VNPLALLVQRVLDGISNGSLYGSLALAIALVYRSTGRVNLVQGELATFGTYLSLVLSSPASAALAGSVFAAKVLPGTPWPLWAAIPAAMVASAVIAAVIERTIIRRVPEHASRSAISLSVALTLLVNAATTLFWRQAQRGYRSPFPAGPGDQFVFGEVRFRFTALGTWATLLSVLLLLHLLLFRSRFGLAFRAVSSSRQHSALCGIRVGRVLGGGWALAAALGTLVGCLAAGRLLLTPSMMMRVLVFALVAAIIGGLASPGGALIGGLIVGVGESLAGGYIPHVDSVLAFPLLVLAMVVMLYFRPQGLFGVAVRRAELQVEPSAAGAARAARPPRLTIVRSSRLWRAGRVSGVVLLIAIATVPVFLLPYLEARLLTEVVATALALWGLGLLVGQAGRISLSHATFMGVGAYGMAILAGRFDVPPLAGVLLAGVIGFCAGIVLGLPALRIKGQHLAIVTLALAVIFPSLLNRFKWFTGGEFGPRPVAVPRVPGWLPFDLPSARTFAWLHLIAVTIAVVAAWLLRNLYAGSVGRAIRASAQHEEAAAAMGVPVTRVRTLAFGLGCGLAALGGALIAIQTQAVTAARFDVFHSLALYAMVAVCGASSMAGASLAALAFVGTPWLFTHFDIRIGAAGVPPDAPGGGAYLGWGIALVLVTLVAPDGLVPAIRRLTDNFVAVVEPEHVVELPAIELLDTWAIGGPD
jgi:branched-subunit amino acid ABC-type transport system permease component